MTDVIGHLLAVGPTLSVRTKRGEVVAVAAADVVAIKALAAAPVRTGDIRNIEHAAALAWPGVEQRWLGGWLLRFGRGSTRRANSAVPLGVRTDSDVSALIDWYAARGVAPLIAAPDRLFRVPPGVPTEAENLVMTGDVTTQRPSPVAIAARPDDDWQSLYRRDVPVDVLTAVVDGEVAFAMTAGAAVGRAAVTTAPDGTRWVGLSALHVVEAARRRGLARELCEALVAWGAERGATRTYAQVLADNTAATRLYESMGFSVHHRSRYVCARSL
jgi:GNAT superfamily N-acetyltransferase